MTGPSGVPHISRQEIACALRACGLLEGDTVLVHSSLSSLGHVDGGADAVIDAILDTLGPEGTAAFPTLTGSAELSDENPPVFRPDVDACWTGAIPEAARKRPNALRSLGPTHSVCAIGPSAPWLTEGHEGCLTPCGAGSPYHKLWQAAGKVLFIGVDLSCNTLFHHVEEMAKAPYVCVERPVAAKVMLPTGESIDVPLRIHAYGPRRDYPKFEPELLQRGILTVSTAGQARLRLLRARPFCELMIPRVAADPAILLA